ncbi:MAG: flavodoxin family protein [Candidatus Faecivicinus sp.]
MHTLIFNGSPHPSGDTSALIAALRRGLSGEISQIDCYRARVSPCVDCRRCVRQPGCAIDDDMQPIYPLIERCDCIVIATPVYFSLPTPPVLSVCSRLQTYFCASFFRKSPVEIRPKRGGILLAGGGSGSAEPAEATARRLLRAMKVRQIGPVAASLQTDRIPAAKDAEALAQAARLADFLNAPALR